MKDHHQVPVASSEPFPTASFLPWYLPWTQATRPDILRATHCHRLLQGLGYAFRKCLRFKRYGMCMYMYIYMWALCQNIPASYLN